jgi:hypothetical protein
MQSYFRPALRMELSIKKGSFRTIVGHNHGITCCTLWSIAPFESSENTHFREKPTPDHLLLAAMTTPLRKEKGLISSETSRCAVCRKGFQNRNHLRRHELSRALDTRAHISKPDIK